MNNRYALPEAIARFAEEADAAHEAKPHRYSVTELLKPVREIALARLHPDECERDVADAIPALLGTAVHKILESMSEGKRAEVPVCAEIGGIEVSGRIDLVDGDAIVDWKTSTVAKARKGDCSDWLRQCKAYAYLLFRQTGEICRKIRIYAILKDWSKAAAARQSGYPQSPVWAIEAEIRDSDYDEAERALREKAEAAEAAIASGTLPECSPEERWDTGDKWALYKKEGDKRAAAVVDSEEEAQAANAERFGGKGSLERRPGESTKCLYYCECAAICGRKGKE